MLHTQRNDLVTGIKVFISHAAGSVGKQCLKISEGKKYLDSGSCF